MSVSRPALGLELDELYAGCKRLTSALAAGIILGAHDRGLQAQAGELLRRGQAALEAGPDRELEGALQACLAMLGQLCLILERGAFGSRSPEELGRVRDLHRSLRREVWKVRDCEYVPCSRSSGYPAPDRSRRAGPARKELR